MSTFTELLTKLAPLAGADVSLDEDEARGRVEVDLHTRIRCAASRRHPGNEYRARLLAGFPGVLLTWIAAVSVANASLSNARRASGKVLKAGRAAAGSLRTVSPACSSDEESPSSDRGPAQKLRPRTHTGRSPAAGPAGRVGWLR